MAEPVRVDVGACRCPGSPHETDFVLLAPKLTVPMGVAGISAIRRAQSDPDAVEAALSNVFMHQSIVGWSIVDESGEVPINNETIDEHIGWTNGGREVIEKANELYAEDLLSPFAQKMAKSSRRMQTDGSTSAKSASGPKRQKLSKQSSLNGSDGNLSVVPVP